MSGFERTLPLAFEPLWTEAAQVIVAGSDPEDEGYRNPAKRRRVEDLARRYVAGHPLNIISARLRGPFDSRWANPWSTRKARASATKRACVPSPSTKEGAGLVRHEPRPHAVKARGLKSPSSSSTFLERVRRTQGGRLEMSRRELRRGHGGHETVAGPSSLEEDETMRSPVSDRLTGGFVAVNSRQAARGPPREECQLDGAGRRPARYDEAWSKTSVRHGSSRTDDYEEATTAKNAQAQSSPAQRRVERLPASKAAERGSLGPARSAPTPTREHGVAAVRASLQGYSPESLQGRREGPPAAEMEVELSVVVQETNLGEADEETIRSMGHAKALSSLAASQASRASSLGAYKPPSVPDRAASEAGRAPPTTFEHTPPSPPLEEVINPHPRRVALSRPEPGARAEAREHHDASKQHACASPSRALARSIHVVPPSTDLPAFRYWHTRNSGATSPRRRADEKPSATRDGSAGPVTATPPSPGSSGKDRRSADAAPPTDLGQATADGDAHIEDDWSLVEEYTNRVIPSEPHAQDGASQKPLKQRLLDAVRRSATSERRPQSSSSPRDRSTSQAGRGPPKGGPRRPGHDEAPTEPTDKDDDDDDDDPIEDESSFSTQTAVAKVQRLFQADITTPGQASGRARAAGRSSGQHKRQARTSAGQTASPRSSLAPAEGDGHADAASCSNDEAALGDGGGNGNGNDNEGGAISTQMLLEAVSPFAVSTAKKQSRTRRSSKRALSAEMARSDGHEAAPSTSPSGSRRPVRDVSTHASLLGSSPAVERGPASAASSKRPDARLDDGTYNPAQLDAVMDEMLGGVLGTWDIQTELQKGARRRRRAAAAPATD